MTTWRSLRACGTVLALVATLAPQVQTTWAARAAAICNRYCDGRDPGLAPVDRVPVTAGLYGRVFTTHVNNTDAMA
jgi:hypothetical protein